MLSPPRKTIVGRIQEHPLVVAAGVLATAIAILSPILDALKRPDIGVSGSDPSQPFALPFTVKNNSSLFAMVDTTPECEIDKVGTREGGGIRWLTLELSPYTVSRDSTGNFTCSIDLVPNDIVSAHIFVYFRYKTLFWQRTSPRAEFTWDTQVSPPRWIEGAFPEAQAQ
jgi:hypothetical protein